MALYGADNGRGELRIHDSIDELRTDLADYIAELSDASVKERGVFTIALSGGSLIGLMGYVTNFPNAFLFFLDQTKPVPINWSRLHESIIFFDVV